MHRILTWNTLGLDPFILLSFSLGLIAHARDCRVIRTTGAASADVILVAARQRAARVRLVRVHGARKRRRAERRRRRRRVTCRFEVELWPTVRVY